MKILLALTFLVLIAVASAFTTIVQGQSPPTYAFPVEYKYNAFITEEGVTTTVHEIINSDGTKMTTTGSTSLGTFTTTIRNDLGYLYYFYFIDNQYVCYAAKFPSGFNYPIRVPNFSGLNYQSQSFYNGKLVNVWRISLYQDLTTIYTDADTGAIVLSADSEFMQTTNSMFYFTNGTNMNPPNDDVFNVPNACQNAPPPQELDEKDIPQDISLISTLAQKLAGKHVASMKKIHHFTDRARKMIDEKKQKYVADETKSISSLLPQIAKDLAHPSQFFEKNHFQPFSGEDDPRYNTQIDNSIYAAPVRNQGAVCGGCWAFSSVAAAEIIWNKVNGRSTLNSAYNRFGRNYSLSVQSVLDCAHGNLNGTAIIESKGCLGGDPLVAMYHIFQNGLPLESAYPYDGANGRVCQIGQIPPSQRIYPIKDAKRIIQDLNQMELALEKYGVVVAIMNTPVDWLTMSQGIYDNPACTPALNHAVTIVGMGTDTKTGAKFWKVKNSFGRAWGLENGYFRIARGKNMCGIEDYGYVPIY